MDNPNILKTESGENLALIAVRAKGMPYAMPKTYEQFLKEAKAIPNRAGFVANSFAWRGRNKPSALNCKAAFAMEDRDFTNFTPKMLDGNSSIAVSDIYGSARRRILLWRKRIEARSVQFSFNPEPSMMVEWEHFSSNMIVSVKKYKKILPTFNPVSQIRLFQEIHSYYKKSDVDKKAVEDLLGFENIFSDIEYSGKDPEKKLKASARVSDSDVWVFCIVKGGNKSQTEQNSFMDEWSSRPVILPELPKTRDVMTGDSLIDLGLVTERLNYQLDENSLLRFTRSLEHFAVHLSLLQHARKFVDDWWRPLLASPSWVQKENAAGNFLRAWQNYCLYVEPLWALGCNDKQIDPAIIISLDQATGLSDSWNDANRRLTNLLQLSTQVIGDGDPSIHLNSTYNEHF